MALSLESLYTKQLLENLSTNIRVVRHPHISIKGGEFLWSHHEKMVCIDFKTAFMGGLDLCYGRMDTCEHFLHDVRQRFWNGIDYSNVRIKDYAGI
mmetsp:Transcript_35989/g.6466  ORF Transcript_35989/g.6466 Transcript_35989/m.6466 type:complete len:96 (+) Transcript_35989:185-472(+)